MRLNSLIRRNGRRGNSIVEVTLMLPFIIFLFIAIFNFGFYAYALISVENAARAAAMRTSGSSGLAASGRIACDVVIGELRSLPGIGAGATCTCDAGTCTVGSQLTVFAQALPAASAPDWDPAWDPAAPPAASAEAARVAVTYQTIKMFPLPWMMGKMTFTRVVRMRI